MGNLDFGTIVGILILLVVAYLLIKLVWWLLKKIVVGTGTAIGKLFDSLENYWHIWLIAFFGMIVVALAYNYPERVVELYDGFVDSQYGYFSILLILGGAVLSFVTKWIVREVITVTPKVFWGTVIVLGTVIKFGGDVLGLKPYVQQMSNSLILIVTVLFWYFLFRAYKSSKDSIRKQLSENLLETAIAKDYLAKQFVTPLVLIVNMLYIVVLHPVDWWLTLALVTTAIYTSRVYRLNPLDYKEQMIQWIECRLRVTTESLKASTQSLTEEDFEHFIVDILDTDRVIDSYGYLYSTRLWSGFVERVYNESKTKVFTITDVYNRLNELIEVGELPVKPLEPVETAIDIAALTNICPWLTESYTKQGELLLIPVQDDEEHSSEYCACEFCGTAVLKADARGKDVKYCSQECLDAHKQENEKIEHIKIDPNRSHVLIDSAGIIHEYTSANRETVFKDLGIKATEYGLLTMANSGADKLHMLGTPQGHGFAAEEANTLIDLAQGKDAKVVGYDNAKSGADRLVDGALIQTKYYKTASGSIGACFENGSYKYLKPNGKPMQVEVPSDQYVRCVQLMKKRIERGEVPGVKDPRYASRLVRKGQITQAQAMAAAEFGTVESLALDAGSAVTSMAPYLCVTSAMSLASAIWKGEDVGVSLKNTCIATASVGGKSLVTQTITSQVGRTTLGGAVRQGAGELVTNAAGVVLSRNAATFIGNLAKTNAISVGVMLVFENAGHISKYLNGDMSGSELAKHVATGGMAVAGSIAGGAAAVSGMAAIGLTTASGAAMTAAATAATTAAFGTTIGGALGSVVPFVGTAIGAMVGAGIAGAVGKFLFGDSEEDKRRRAEEAEEERRRIMEENKLIQAFLDVLNQQLIRWSQVYMLTNEEVERVVEALQRHEGTAARYYADDQELVRFTYLSIARSENGYVAEATRILRSIIVDIVGERPVIEMVDGEVTMQKEMTEFVEQIS